MPAKFNRYGVRLHISPINYERTFVDYLGGSRDGTTAMLAGAGTVLRLADRAAEGTTAIPADSGNEVTVPMASERGPLVSDAVSGV